MTSSVSKGRQIFIWKACASDHIIHRQQLRLGAAFFDQRGVECRHGIAARAFPQERQQRMATAAQPAPDHRQPEAHRDAEMLGIALADRGGVSGEQAQHHGLPSGEPGTRSCAR